MESAVEEAFEVQVLHSFHGWRLERFCDRSGNTYHELTRAALQVSGRDDRLNGVKETPVLEAGVLHSSDWLWSHAWMADSEYTQCDEEGWTYGSSIERINCRLAEGTSKMKRGCCHFLRRRRWIRTRVRTPLPIEGAAQDMRNSTALSPSYEDRDVRESRVPESLAVHRLPVSQPDLEVIETAIQNDTGFLYRAGVIDYSLLLRFDEDKRQVVVGLIDYLHQFDFLKKMESTSKASFTFRDPTVVSPISYRHRFMNAMSRYFVGIEKELEIRMRKRCKFKLKPGMLRPSGALTLSPAAVTFSTSSTSTATAAHKLRTDEEKHADVAARLVGNMSLTSESSLISEGFAARSECRLSKLDSDWTSTKLRGHSMSRVSDHEVCCGRVSRSDCDCNSSPYSSYESVKNYPATSYNNSVILEEYYS